MAALVVLVAGCAGIEGDIQRAELREFVLNIVQGKDRGAADYARTIDQSSTRPRGAHYQYIAPAHLAHFNIERSVRGLGSTKTPNSDYLAFVTYKLLYVLRYDPGGSVRSLACEELGRVLLRLPRRSPPPLPGESLTEQKINQIAQDLAHYAVQLKKGRRVSRAAILERMQALARKRPTTARSAHQMVRAVAVRPAAWSSDSEIRKLSKAIVPGIVHDAILLALREHACGDPNRPDLEADPSALARLAAIRVLTRVRSPVALDGALARLQDPVDPAEHDPDARGALCEYLGVVGGAKAFETCAVRLADSDANVRYHAQRALVLMTGARVEPKPEAWRAWREKHPSRRVPPRAPAK